MIINPILLGNNLNHLTLGRDYNRLSGLQHSLHVKLANLTRAQRNGPAALKPLKVTSGDTDAHVEHIYVRHDFNVLNRTTNSIYGRVHVNDQTLFHAMRRMRTETGNNNLAILLLSGKCGDFSGSDINCYKWSASFGHMLTLSIVK